MTLYRVECNCGGFSACTREQVEAAKMKVLHMTWNADTKRRPGEVHRVKVTATFDGARPENQGFLDVLGAPEPLVGVL